MALVILPMRNTAVGEILNFPSEFVGVGQRGIPGRCTLFMTTL